MRLPRACVPSNKKQKQQQKQQQQQLQQQQGGSDRSHPTQADQQLLRTHHLYHAATRGDEKSVRALLESGVNVNAAPGEGGATPLYAVSVTGHCAMVQLLLDCKARPDVALKTGQTPLIAATESGRADVARILLESGCDVNAYTNGGKTALMIACQCGQGALARLLLNEGASTGEAKKGKGTALYCAASMGHADCVRMLLEEGDDEMVRGRGHVLGAWARAWVYGHDLSRALARRAHSTALASAFSAAVGAAPPH